MTFRFPIIAAAAAHASVVMLMLPAPKVLGQSCTCSGKRLCAQMEMAQAVIRGEVLRSSAPEKPKNKFEDVVYKIRVKAEFKSEAVMDLAGEIDVATSSEPSSCDIFLEVGEEYVLDLYWSGDDWRSMGVCGATQSWTSLLPEEIAELKNPSSACAEPCDLCGKYQKCELYSGNTAEGQYFCSAVCTPDPCASGEVCRLVEQDCPDDSMCGMLSSCSPAKEKNADPCAACGKAQECLVWYSPTGAEEEFYCADLCDPSPCTGRGETCTLLEESDCDPSKSPCPPVARCASAVVEPSVKVNGGGVQGESSSALRLAAARRTTAAAALVANLLLELCAGSGGEGQSSPSGREGGTGGGGDDTSASSASHGRRWNCKSAKGGLRRGRFGRKAGRGGRRRGILGWLMWRMFADSIQDQLSISTERRYADIPCSVVHNGLCIKTVVAHYRTGVYLLSLWKMVWGVAYIKVEQWNIPLLVKSLQKGRTTYKQYCTGPIVKQDHQCDAILRQIAVDERSLEFLQSSVSTYYAIGIFYILFSLVGWRAAYTNSPMFAKIFMAGFPAAFMIGLLQSFLAPGDESPLTLSLSALFAFYFFKVAWSFFTRVRIAEQANRILAEGGLEGGRRERGSLAGSGSSAAGIGNNNSAGGGVELASLSP